MPGTEGATRTSGNIEGERQFRWRADFLDEHGQSASQVSYCFFAGGTIAHRADSQPDLGGRTPDTVFVLFDGRGPAPALALAA
jgi:hypothetical protein